MLSYSSSFARRAGVDCTKQVITLTGILWLTSVSVALDEASSLPSAIVVVIGLSTNHSVPRSLQEKLPGSRSCKSVRDEHRLARALRMVSDRTGAVTAKLRSEERVEEVDSLLFPLAFLERSLKRVRDRVSLWHSEVTVESSRYLCGDGVAGSAESRRS